MDLSRMLLPELSQDLLLQLLVGADLILSITEDMSESPPSLFPLYSLGDDDL